MRKLLLALILALLTALILGQWMLQDPGYVQIIRGPWEIQTSLAFAVLALLALAVIFAALILLLGSLWNLLAPNRLTERWRRYQSDRRLKTGLLALVEGRWEKAEKRLVSSAQRGDWPLPGWLAAALSADLSHNRLRAREHLHKASACPSGELPAALLSAHLAINEGALGRAREILEGQREAHPKNPLLLRQLVEVYERGESWQPLVDVLPQLKKVDPDVVALSLRQRRAWQGLMKSLVDQSSQKGREETLIELRKLWKSLPGEFRGDSALRARYAGYLAQLGDGVAALSIVTRDLEQHWDDRLPRVLEVIDDVPAAKLLRHLEGWLESHPENTGLLVSAGRVAMKARLWGKARSLFETAANRNSSAALAELSRLYLALGDNERAASCLEKQIRLSSASLPKLPLPSESR